MRQRLFRFQNRHRRYDRGGVPCPGAANAEAGLGAEFFYRDREADRAEDFRAGGRTESAKSLRVSAKMRVGAAAMAKSQRLDVTDNARRGGSVCATNAVCDDR